MKKMTLVVALLSIFGLVNAQSSYRQAIGARISTHEEYAAFAASFKFFVTEPGAVELNLGVGNRRYFGDRAPGVSLAGTYQHHFNIRPVAGLKWFIGGGAVAFNSKSTHPDYDGFGFGIYPTGGVDYKFANIPLNLSADVRPTIYLTAPNAYPSVYGGEIGLAARFTF
jgi:hypothetical protein